MLWCNLHSSRSHHLLARRDYRVPLVAVAALALLAAGCSGAAFGGQAAADPEEPDITVAAVPSADLAGVYIAQDLGYFKDEGLNVTLKRITSSRQIISAQLKGQIDICAGAYPPYILAQATGEEFSILAEGSVMTRSTRVLLTPPHSPITAISQLAGKTIGLEANNTIGTLLVSAMLTDNGISAKQVRFEADPQGYPTMARQLSHGAWDAAFFGEPFATQAEEEYGEVPLTDLNSGAATGLPIDGYIATRAWASAHPDTVSAFTRAIERAQRLADTDPAAARRALAASDGLPPTVTDVMAIPDFPTGPVDAGRIQREATDMLQFGMLGRKYAAQITSGALVKAMTGSRP